MICFNVHGDYEVVVSQLYILYMCELHHFIHADINECPQYEHCHKCINVEGSYRCKCNEGYYLSLTAGICFGKR